MPRRGIDNGIQHHGAAHCVNVCLCVLFKVHHTVTGQAPGYLVHLAHDKGIFAVNVQALVHAHVLRAAQDLPGAEGAKVYNVLPVYPALVIPVHHNALVVVRHRVVQPVLRLHVCVPAQLAFQLRIGGQQLVVVLQVCVENLLAVLYLLHARLPEQV